MLRFLIVFAAIGVWRWSVVSRPPCEEQCTGLWAEASFLADSNFDYYALAFEQNDFLSDVQGPRSYLITVIPLFVAILMKTCHKPETTFLIAHLATFACAAMAIAGAYELLTRVTTAAVAALLCVALATTPLFAVQIDMLGMDIPMTMCAVWAAVLLLDRRPLAALAMSLAAFFMKSTGGVVTAAIAAYLSLWWLSLKFSAKPIIVPRLFTTILVAWALVAVEFLLIEVGQSPVKRLLAMSFPDFLRLEGAILWCPDVVILVLIAALGSLAWLVRAANSRRTGSLATDGSDAILVFSWLVIAGFIFTFARHIFITRYFTCSLPFLFLVLAGAVLRRLPNRIAIGCVLALIAVNLLNTSGRFFPAIDVVADDPFFRNAPNFTTRSCAFVERSREYQIQQAAVITLARRLEAERSPVFVTLPYRWFLDNPRLGYVTRPLPVHEALHFYETISQYRDRTWQALQSGAPTPILVWNGAGRATLPAPTAADEIVFEDRRLHPPLIAYRKRWPKDACASRVALENACLAAIETARWPVCLPERIAFLENSGRLDRAIHEARELDRKLDPKARRPEWLPHILSSGAGDRATESRRRLLANDFPAIGASDLELANALELLVDPYQADQAYRQLPDSQPLPTRFTDSLYSQAIWRLQHLDATEAARVFALALEDGLSGQERPLAYFALGLIRLKQGHQDQADTYFRRALDSGQTIPEACNYLGMIARAKQRSLESRAWFERAAQTGDAYAAPRVNLIQLDAQEGRWSEAREELERVLSHSDPGPQLTELRNGIQRRMPQLGS